MRQGSGVSARHNCSQKNLWPSATNPWLPPSYEISAARCCWLILHSRSGRHTACSGKLHLLCLTGRAGQAKYQCWSGGSTEILEASCQCGLNWASVLGLQLNARDNRTLWMWRPKPNIPLLCALRASRYFDPPHFFLQRLPFKQMSNARWKDILLQEGILNLILDNSVPSE